MLPALRPKMTNETRSTIPALWGEVEMSPCSLSDRKIGVSPIEIHYSYFNNLPVPVVIVPRSGLAVNLERQHSMYETSLIIRVEINFTKDSRKSLERVLSSVNSNSSEEMKTIKKAFLAQTRDNIYSGGTIILDYPVNIDNLHAANGTLYYKELDLLVSVLPIDEVPDHPYSDAGRQQQMIFRSQLDEEGIAFGYFIEIIDNQGKYQERYVNIGNQIYRINPKKDESRKDGVYIVTNQPVDKDINNNERHVQYYPFDGAEEKLGLYRTREDAVHFGDLTLAKKHEIANLEHSLLTQKAEMQSEKIRYDRELMEKDRELKLLELERQAQLSKLAAQSDELRLARERADHLAALERQRIKDYYEERSQSRKDSSELLKYVPSIITGVGAILTVLATRQAKA
jgi:hypothetical protein